MDELSKQIISILISYLVGLAVYGSTYLMDKRYQTKIQKALKDSNTIRVKGHDRSSFRKDFAEIAVKVAKSRRAEGVSRVEESALALLSDELFQKDLADWLMLGNLTACGSRKKVSDSIKQALCRGGASGKQIEWFSSEYLTLVDRKVFEDQSLTHWREHQAIAYMQEQLKEVCEQAAEAAGNYSVERQQAAMKRYFEVGLRTWDIIDLDTLSIRDLRVATERVLLRQLYVPLRVNVESIRERQTGEDVLDRIEKRRVERGELSFGNPPEMLTRVPIGKPLGDSKRIVILGDPGCGKTTLIRWIATAYLLRSRNDSSWRDLPDVDTLPGEDWVPVIIRCRDLGDADLCRSFAEFLEVQLKKMEFTPDEAEVIKAVILHRMDKGKALVMIDGLDEIADPRIRMIFCRQLECVARRHAGTPIIVSSRIVGYREMPFRMDMFEHVDIANLSDNDKSYFAFRWVEVTGRHHTPEERQRRAEKLSAALQSKQVKRLANNPMLLTTLALVQRGDRNLPPRAVELYREAVKVLLNWNCEVYGQIDEREVMPQLEYIAYALCNSNDYQVKEYELLSLLEGVRNEYHRVRLLSNRSEKRFLSDLEARSSIMIKSGVLASSQGEDAVYEFKHSMIQAYLASRSLHEGFYPKAEKRETLAKQVAHLAGLSEADDGRLGKGKSSVSWHEVLKLCVADCNYDFVDEVLISILNPPENKDALRSRAILAASCLADGPYVELSTGQKVLEALAKAIREGDGNGYRSNVDAVAMELVHTEWFSLMVDCLVKEFRKRDPLTCTGAGSVCGMVCVAHDLGSSKTDDSLKLGEHIRCIAGGDHTMSIAAALTIADAAYNRLVVLEDGLIEALLMMLRRDAPSIHAAAWGLAWLARRGTWKPNYNEVSSLLKGLDSPDCDEEGLWWLVFLFAGIRELRSVPLIILLLDHHSPRIRAFAADKLGDFGDAQAVERLISLLHDDHSTVRISAGLALTKLDDKRGRVAILDGLKFQEPAVRQDMVRVLACTIEYSYRILLSQNMDREAPYIDPIEPIDLKRVEEVSRTKNMSSDEVRRRYEVLSAELGLVLAWEITE